MCRPRALCGGRSSPCPTVSLWGKLWSKSFKGPPCLAEEFGPIDRERCAAYHGELPHRRLRDRLESQIALEWEYLAHSDDLLSSAKREWELFMTYVDGRRHDSSIARDSELEASADYLLWVLDKHHGCRYVMLGLYPVLHECVVARYALSEGVSLYR